MTTSAVMPLPLWGGDPSPSARKAANKGSRPRRRGGTIAEAADPGIAPYGDDDDDKDLAEAPPLLVRAGDGEGSLLLGGRTTGETPMLPRPTLLLRCTLPMEDEMDTIEGEGATRLGGRGCDMLLLSRLPLPTADTAPLHAGAPPPIRGAEGVVPLTGCNK